ncbi:MAG: tripartite tricarboxylate transporter substrate binding protein [Casimicrobiaceae bacterium]|nr:tripartite tricarboxylate transporter substrate binding protein [Casimicrobiaceae bacterium]MCX8099498.1 tripartite tricarboxylate transporter substrate binding protein [Casimicrobiaceae bacterium]MDW8312825.1 tripartite tricarboxylate transporter substrate binding protein [Burkholderiales bacterium]
MSVAAFGRACVALAFAFAANLVTTAAAQAPQWPAKPVTIVVPFPPGGGTDAFARPLSAYLSKVLGQQFVIDNRGGAGGTIGAAHAAKAAPDGYTFFMGAVHHAIAPSLYPKLDYDIEKSFVPVALVSSVPQVIVVNPQRVAANDLKGFIEAARRAEGKMNFGSAGNGSSHHLAGELFNSLAGVKIAHVPYRGAGPALADLIAGQIDAMFDGMGSSAAHIRSGRIKAIAVAAEQRAPGFPNIPTAKEQGLNYVVSTWYGLWAPAGTPPAIIQKFQNDLRQAFASEELKNLWHSMGAEMPNLYGEAFGRFVSSEIRRWAEVVRTSGAKLD